MATNDKLLTWKGSTDKSTDGQFFAEEYNLSEIDTTQWENMETAVDNIESSNQSGTTTDTTTTYSTPTGWIPTAEYLSSLNRDEVIQKKYDTLGEYTETVKNFDKWSIVDKMRIKTGWVADIDNAINKLKIDYNTSRSKLMERYASVIDPTKREALISAEESNIAKQISDLRAVRQYRLGTIKDMTNAEISRQENKLKALDAQYKLYSDVLWDMDKADKFKKDMEKAAIDIQKSRAELKAYEDKYWLEMVQRIEWKTSQELWPYESNVKQIWTWQITWYWSDKWKWGLDIDWTLWQELTPMIDWQVTYVWDEWKWFWNQVKILDSNWNEVWYSHLQNFNVKQWQQIKWSDVIWAIWNTWTTMPGVWWDWSHVDITIKKPDWSYMTPQEVEKYLEWGVKWEPRYEKTKETIEDGTQIKFTDFVKSESKKIIEVLKWKEALNVFSEISSDYPGEKNIIETISRTLNDTDKKDIAKNLLKIKWITWKKEDYNDFAWLIQEYSELFYPATWDSVTANKESQSKTANLMLKVLDLPSSEWNPFKKNLEELLKEKSSS